MEEIFARAKNADEAIGEFRKFKEDTSEAEPPKPKKRNGSGYYVAHNETELARRLDEGANLVQNLSGDKWLLKF